MRLRLLWGAAVTALAVAPVVPAEAASSGVNDFSCRPSAAHPEPVPSVVRAVEVMIACVEVWLATRERELASAVSLDPVEKNPAQSTPLSFAIAMAAFAASARCSAVAFSVAESWVGPDGL